MNKVSFKGRKTERKRSGSLVQPRRAQRALGGCRVWRVQLCTSSSAKVCEHQLPTQLCTSTAALAFFAFFFNCGDGSVWIYRHLQWALWFAGCGCGERCADAGVYHLEKKWLSHRRSFAIFKIIDGVCYQHCFKTES